MPALPPYIPSKDADLDNWLTNFNTLITASPATYGLVAGDAVAIDNAVDLWHAAFLLTTSPSTKTADTVQDKNTEKINVLNVVRPYAQQVANNAGVTSANKIALGLNPQTSTPTPITEPTTNPVLTIDMALTQRFVVRYRDSLAAPSVKAKPYGVTAVEIFAKTSVTAIVDPEELDYNTAVSKSPFFVDFDVSDVGKRAYIAARYRTQTGLVGPWSPIISFVVAGS